MLKEHMHVTISPSGTYEENNIVKGKKKHNINM